MDTIKWIDSHCHFESYIKQGNLEEILQNAKRANVSKMIAVGTHDNDWPTYHKLSTEHPQTIYYSVGLHPCYVEEGWEDQMPQIMPFFYGQSLPVALGEIGLDNFHLPKDPEEAKLTQIRQEAAFKKQLTFAYQLDCPIIIHSRNAFHQTLNLIDQSGVNWEKVVFHCFSEGPEEIKLLNDRGARASFTGVITYKNAENVRAALLAQGIQKLMLETDAPYLPPVPHRSEYNQPAYIPIIANQAANTLNQSHNLQSFANQLWDNTVSFFKLT